MDSQETKQLSTRFEPEVRSALNRASKEQQRSLNGQVVWYVLEGLRRDGLLGNASDRHDETVRG